MGVFRFAPIVNQIQSDREDRSSDVCHSGDARWSFSEKDNDSMLHTHHLSRTESHRKNSVQLASHYGGWFGAHSGSNGAVDDPGRFGKVGKDTQSCDVIRTYCCCDRGHAPARRGHEFGQRRED